MPAASAPPAALSGAFPATWVHVSWFELAGLCARVLAKNTGQKRTQVDADVIVGRRASGRVRFAREKRATAEAHLQQPQWCPDAETYMEACHLAERC